MTNVFILTDSGIIELESIDVWGQNTHLAFANTDCKQKNLESADDGQEKVNFITNELDEITFSQYMSELLKSDDDVSDTGTIQTYLQPIQKGE